MTRAGIMSVTSVAAAARRAAHANPGGDGVDVVELPRGQFVVDAARGLGFESLREGALRARALARRGALRERGRRGDRRVRLLDGGGSGLHDGGRRLRGRGRADGLSAARPGRAIAQRLSHGTAGLSGRVEAFGHGHGGVHVDGSNLGDGARLPAERGRRCGRAAARREPPRRHRVRSTRPRGCRQGCRRYRRRARRMGGPLDEAGARPRCHGG